MAVEVGAINLGLSVNQKTFNNQLKGIARSAEKPIMNAFKGMGKMIGGALAVGTITKFAKECLSLGSDLSEVQNVVDTTFSTMSAVVDEFAKGAIFSFGMSETVAKKYMGTLGAMSKAMGFSEEAAFSMSKEVTGLAGDVASFYNLSTDEAFDKLKSIWTGETETLKAIGVLLTQTNLDQYALNNGFGKTTAQMTEQEKVMLRYRYTMSSLSDASGDFAKTSESWANQTRVLSLQFDSLKATMGQGFINLFTPIIRVVNELIQRLQVLAQLFKIVTELLTGNRGEDASGIAAVVENSKSAAEGLNEMAGAAKKAANATKQLSAIDELDNLRSAMASNSSNGAGATDIGLSMLGEEAGKTSNQVSELENDIRNFANNVAEFLIDNFGGNVERAFEKIKTSALNMRDVFAGVFSDCKSLGEPLLKWFKTDFIRLLKTRIDTAGNVISGLTDIFTLVFSDIWNRAAYPMLKKLIEHGLPMFTDFAIKMNEVGNYLFEEIKNIFTLIWTDASSALETFAKIWSDVLIILKEFWDKYGVTIFEEFSSAINNVSAILQAAWSNIIKPIFDAAISVIDEVWDNHLKKLTEDIIDLIGELAVSALMIYNEVIAPIRLWLMEILKPAIEDVSEVVKKILTTVYGCLYDTVSSIIAAIGSVIEFLTGVFTGDWEKAWSGIEDFFKNIWNGIVSFGKMQINVLLGLINGMITGIVGGINTVIKALNALKIEAPDWVANMTGITSFGFDLEELTAPQIPMLASGGYVGPNQPQLAMIGDNKHEGEIVSPESKLLDMAIKAAKMSGGGNTELLMRIIEILEKILDKPEGITDDDVFKSVMRSEREVYRRTGRGAFEH